MDLILVHCGLFHIVDVVKNIGEDFIFQGINRVFSVILTEVNEWS